MIKLLIISTLLASCAQSPRTDANQVKGQWNEYKYVMSVWEIGSQSYRRFRTSPNTFRNDYYSTINKNTKQDRLVYYFEKKDFSLAFKLILFLNNDAKTTAEFWEMQPDFKSCSQENFAVGDFRRQSCYVLIKNLWQGRPHMLIDQLHQQVLTSLPKF